MPKWEEKVSNPQSTDFQTPEEVCKYMVNMIPKHARTILEPTPGDGNLVRALQGFRVTAPKNFFDLDPLLRFDSIVMNPPFSSKHGHSIPDDLQKSGMLFGYHILEECMEKSDSVIALMPWFTITDSDVRLRRIYRYGLKSITALPRKTFGYTRIQTCIFEMRRGWTGHTLFYPFEFNKP